MTIPIEPMLTVHGEEVLVLRPVTGESSIAAQGIVSVDTDVANPGLALQSITVSVPASSPLATVGLGGRCRVRGVEYGVRLVAQGDDPGWRRVHLA